MDVLAPTSLLGGGDGRGFRALEHSVVARLADHLDACTRREGSVLPWMRPDDLARRLAVRLRQAGFEVPVEPVANIVCFRYPNGGDVRRAIVEGGEFHPVQTRLAGPTYLRTTLIIPSTTEQDLSALIDAVRSSSRASGGAA